MEQLITKHEREVEQSKMQLNAFLTRKFDMEREIENCWVNDKDESRVTFNKAVKALAECERNDFFPSSCMLGSS